MHPVRSPASLKSLRFRSHGVPVSLLLSRRSRRVSSCAASQFAELAAEPGSRYQLYVSRSEDPFINLSIEQYLLKNSPTNSTVLFLYVNRPCVVIGRNQNPWLEANLRLLRLGFDHGTNQDQDSKAMRREIDLVRRRSGGGTVFHDHGNVNYCVICPSVDFTRDRHAEMVVKAIRKDNSRARVNERHDIVLDTSHLRDEQDWPDESDMHRTKYCNSYPGSGTRKVSGSAYKLNRNRSLHHGTCLIQSPNLHKIPQYLQSPARSFMKARGVDSVRSPVANVYPGLEIHSQLLNSTFQRNVLEAFVSLYSVDREALASFTERNLQASLHHNKNWVSGYLNETLADLREIQSGIDELKSPDWIYGQTPQFTLENHSSEEENKEKNRVRPALPQGMPQSARIFITSRSGTITASEVSMSPIEAVARAEVERYSQILDGTKIHSVSDFGQVLRAAPDVADPAPTSLAAWLNVIFGK